MAVVNVQARRIARRLGNGKQMYPFVARCGSVPTFDLDIDAAAKSAFRSPDHQTSQSSACDLPLPAPRF